MKNENKQNYKMVAITPEDHKRLKEIANSNDTTIIKLVSKWINEYK